jgi:hypothetical protein
LRSKYLLVVASFVLLLVVLSARPADAKLGCGIGLSVQPPVVNYPSNGLPLSGGLTFSEIVDVNYTSNFVNEKLNIQYLNGSQWADLQSFTGNSVGFTEVNIGLNSAWTRFGENYVRVESGSCTSDVASFIVKADPSAIGLDVATYLAVILLILLFLKLGRQLGWKRFVVFAAAVYLVLAPWTGQRYDIFFLLSSGIRILQHVNPFSPGSPPAYPSPLKWAYPPLYALYSAFSFLVYQGLTGSPLPAVGALTYPGWLTATYSVFLAYIPATLPVLVFLLKLPMVASAVLTGLLLRRMTGSQSSAIFWLASPLVILVAAVWGQLDPIATLFAIASVYFFGKGKEYHAYLFASLGAAVKVWPALLIPILLVVSLRRAGLRAAKPLVAVLPALLITVALYAAYGNPLQSLFILAYARGIPTFAGAFSVKGLTWQEILFVLGSPPVPLFLYVGIPLYATTLVWAYWKREDDVVKLLLISVLIFFLTYNYVNPQYFYWITPFLILQRRKLAYLVFSALPVLFVALSYNVFYFISPAALPDQFALGASIVDQLKVSAFYQSPFTFVLVAGMIPTAVYVALLYSELGRKAVKPVPGGLGRPRTA